VPTRPWRQVYGAGPKGPATNQRIGAFRIVECFKHSECCEIEVGLMTPKRRSRSETVQDALLGIGVVVPMLLMLILLWAVR